MITGAMRNFMRNVQVRSMQHKCRIEPYIVAEDGTVSYGDAFETICGFSVETSSNSRGAVFDSIQVDAQLRLPLDTYIGMKDRVTILEAYGEETEERVFEVVKIPETYGPSAIVVSLQEIYA